jgi:hypothetical protein
VPNVDSKFYAARLSLRADMFGAVELASDRSLENVYGIQGHAVPRCLY